MVAKSKGAVKTPEEQADQDDWEASAAGWETVGSENGECIDWADNPRFMGIYLGGGETVNKEGEPFQIHKFDRHGEKYFAWANWTKL
jgi:hypothetical protein